MGLLTRFKAGLEGMLVLSAIATLCALLGTLTFSVMLQQSYLTKQVIQVAAAMILFVGICGFTIWAVTGEKK